LIKANNLSKSYNGNRIFSGIEFNVEKSRILGVVGNNGSGKTTLLKIVAGIINSDTGSINFKEKIKLDFLGHENMLYQNFSISENINFFSEISGFKICPELQDKIEKALGLQNILGKKISDLSYGQRKKASMLRLLISDPDLLILDEPFSNLDSDSTDSFISILKTLRESGKSIIISSNRKDIVGSVSDNLLNMDDYNE
jgi:ABC-type multidrug transport system ATPase subunit